MKFVFVVCLYLYLILLMLSSGVNGQRQQLRSSNVGRLRKRPNISCPLITIKNGRLRAKGQFVQFVCVRGFTLVGEKYSKCQPKGTWDNEPPKCVKGSCQTTPKPPAHGYTHMSHKNAVYNFYCEPGYDLLGEKAIFCDGKSWEGKIPSCIPTGKQPELFCDFENADMCGWNHDVNHDFDWTRHNRATPSFHLGTGPHYDITKGPKGDGFYMYTEATTKNHNDIARLISPIYKGGNPPQGGSETQEFCFEFYYHMYGIQTGELRVYVREVTSNDEWDLTKSQPIFFKQGNQENAWHYNLIRIGEIPDDFQIIFEAKRGSGYLSDIAIDNVRLIPNCTLDPELIEPSTTTLSYEEEEETSEYEYLNFDGLTCANRCGLNSGFFTSNGQEYVGCQCNERCLINNTCCPDYFAECFDITSTITSITDTENYEQSSTDSTTTNDEYDNKTTEINNDDILSNQTTIMWKKIDDVLVTVPASTPPPFLSLNSSTPFLSTPSSSLNITFATTIFNVQSTQTEKTRQNKIDDTKNKINEGKNKIDEGKQNNKMDETNTKTTRKPFSYSSSPSFSLSHSSLPSFNPLPTFVNNKKTTLVPAMTTMAKKKTAKKTIRTTKKTIAVKKTTAPTTKRIKINKKPKIPTLQTKKMTFTTFKPKPTTSIIHTYDNYNYNNDLGTFPPSILLQFTKEYSHSNSNSNVGIDFVGGGGKVDAVSSKHDDDETKEKQSKIGIIIGLSSAFVIILFFVALMVRKYVRSMGGRGYLTRRGLGFGATRRSESMSDVRFLSHEEQLDFTLRTE